MDKNRYFLGYFESEEEATHNKLFEQVEAIKNSYNGKIFEGISHEEFSYNVLEEMVSEAKEHRCNKVILLVKEDVDARRVEEILKEDNKKAFDSIQVVSESFKRKLKEEEIKEFPTEELLYKVSDTYDLFKELINTTVTSGASTIKVLGLEMVEPEMLVKVEVDGQPMRWRYDIFVRNVRNGEFVINA